MRFVVPLVVVALLVGGCGEGPDPVANTGTKGPPTVADQADQACVDFYRYMAESVVEERIYYAEFADRIDTLGFPTAAENFRTLVGVSTGEVAFEGQEPEMAALMAEAGATLGEAGATRCFDLAEAWGILEYERRPSATELFERQRSIWEANRLLDYKAHVVIGDGTATRQCHVSVVGGDVAEISDAVTGESVGRPPFDLPFTVDGIYEEIEAGREVTFDYVYSAPRTFAIGDVRVFYDIDLDEYPEPHPLFEGEVAAGCGS